MQKAHQNLVKAVNWVANYTGHPVVLVVLVIVLAAWFSLSRVLEYQLWFDIMDVTIFVVTFLMVFVVQASQNADTQAIQDKLDAIIEALPKADGSVEGEEERIKKGKESGR